MTNQEISFSSHRSHFYIIPDYVMRDSELSSSEKLFYSVIYSLTGRFGFCFATNEYFFKEYHWDERKIRRWLERLQEKKYIHISLEHGSKRKIYVKTPEIVEEGGRTKMSGGEDINVRGGGH